ncbi:hypothetical protein L596_025227 [Steinernema carpocapsae]|uniref:Uncharacterized protein n=1 Tax=Steinernema carpocapsae TaxID=34508 RepID=A0A4U5M763_STECR|nr:hypothetical protein L596_025227 [Steinernema carpocapsae]
MGTQPAPREKLCIQVTASGDLGRIRRGISLRLHRAQTRPETRQHGVEISVYPGSTSTPNRSGGSIAFAAIRPFRPALVRIFRAVVAFFVFSVAAESAKQSKQLDIGSRITSIYTSLSNNSTARRSALLGTTTIGWKKPAYPKNLVCSNYLHYTLFSRTDNRSSNPGLLQ